ncbi:MAG: hypothetical protein EBZ58_12815 [Bacteroidetes bacterium]|nr:hypothetical protein [Bacteroidota bacterium]
MSQQKKSFLELLYGPDLPLYFNSVAKTNMDGFSSAEPNKGLWEVFVYEQSTPQLRSAVDNSRRIRDKFVIALSNLGVHIRELNQDGRVVLNHLHSDKLTGEEQLHFDMFFNIVHNSEKDDDEKAKEISVRDFKKLSSDNLEQYRVNVKTLIKDLDVNGAYTANLKKQQKGGAPTQKLALITCFVPLIKSNEPLTDMLQRDYNELTRSPYAPPYLHRRDIDEEEEGEGQPLVSGTGKKVGSGQKGGYNDEIRAAILRLELENAFENDTRNQSINNVVSAEEIASYLACNPEPAKTVPSNTVTLSSLATNSWLRLSDGSYQKLTPQGYMPLSSEECLKVLNGTCAGSNISDQETCKNFMEAINNQNVEKIVSMLTDEQSKFVWESNAVADSVNKLHPETVLKILRTLGFGTKSGPFGKRVCSVEEWLNECVKSSKLMNGVNESNLKSNMRAYLEHLVSFVNSNPSLVDPSKQKMASMVSIPVPAELAQIGLYNAAADYNEKPNRLNWDDVSRALQTTTCSGFNLRDISLYPTMAFGAVVGQRGGTHLYTQATTAQLNLSSGICQMVEQVLKSLQATNQGLNPVDEKKLREKVQALTNLEQEILSNIMQLNQMRIASEGGFNCYDQMRTTQDRLMQLGSVYDRRVPCLQELCEQLRMLLAQQQNKSGYEPL